MGNPHSHVGKIAGGLDVLPGPPSCRAYSMLPERSGSSCSGSLRVSNLEIRPGSRI